MLKKSEELVLKVIKDNALSNDSTLISKESIVAFIGNEKLVDVSSVESAVKTLYAGDYIDMLLTSKHGEEIYLITLLKKGKNYDVEKKGEIRKIKNKILLAIVGALVSFIVGRILILLFS